MLCWLSVVHVQELGSLMLKAGKPSEATKHLQQALDMLVGDWWRTLKSYAPVMCPAQQGMVLSVETSSCPLLCCNSFQIWGADGLGNSWDCCKCAAICSSCEGAAAEVFTGMPAVTVQHAWHCFLLGFCPYMICPMVIAHRSICWHVLPLSLIMHRSNCMVVPAQSCCQCCSFRWSSCAAAGSMQKQRLWSREHWASVEQHSGQTMCK